MLLNYISLPRGIIPIPRLGDKINSNGHIIGGFICDNA